MYSGLLYFMKKYLQRGHKEYRRSLRELKQTEWISREKLEAMQLQKIQRLVKYAFENVPFYRERYQREGLHPQDIKSFKDFQALPFLTRDDVNNNLKLLVSRVYQGDTYEDMTGGSTGTPMHFIMDKRALWESSAVETRCRGWYGIIPGDKMAWVWGNPKDFPSWRWRSRLGARIRRRRYLNSRTMDELKMQDFAEMLLRWQPAMFRAYPSALYLFASYLKEQNVLNIRPKLIEVGAEKTTLQQRQLFEEVFQAPVADAYGAWESGSIAYQCPEGSLHIIENRYVELVSGDQVVPPGQMGDVVITPLNQYAMPFIRYKNNDIGILESASCACGRNMPVLREVVGRDCDLLVNPDGKVVHWSSIKITVEKIPGIYRYQVYQPDKQHIEVRLLCKQLPDAAKLEAHISNELQPCFGDKMLISVKLVNHIEFTKAGKHRYIISEVKPDSY